MKRIHFILLGLFGNDLNFVSAELYSNFSNVQSFLDSIQASNTIELVGLINRIRGGPDNLAWLDCILLGAVVIAGMELINYLVKTIGSIGRKPSQYVPVRGKHLDVLSMKDKLFIGLSKFQTPPFTYFLFKYMWNEPNAVWQMNQVNLMNTLAPLPIFFVVYDFFYTILHWALHIKAIYRFVHKHHHHQKAPSRAQIDAINVHPVEFALGEYNHLFAAFLCCRLLGMQMHVCCVVLILLFSAVLASLNHTRFDVCLQVMGLTLFDSKVHDVHHRFPQSNFGQYIMLWDHIFGTFRPYNPNDRIIEGAQLNPISDQSINGKGIDNEKDD